MKKLILIASLVFALTGPAFARQIVLLPAKASSSTTILAGNSGATGATIYTASMDVSDATTYALSYLVNSTATTISANCTPSVTMLVQQSFQLPATEETADIAWSTPNTQSLANNITNGRWYTQSLTVLPSKYLRFIVKGLAPNATDTTVQINLSKQYDV